MKCSVFLLLLLLALGPPAFSQEKQEDCSTSSYCEEYLRKILKNPVLTGVSMSQKRISRLGDRAAIGLLKGLSDSELLDPGNIPIIIRLVRLAFANHGLIEAKMDRRPHVALLVLQHVESKSRDENHRKQIRELIAELKQIATRAPEGAPPSKSEGTPPL